MSTTEFPHVIQTGSAKIHCFGCGQEMVERDENGNPIHWRICRDCPYRIAPPQSSNGINSGTGDAS